MIDIPISFDFNGQHYHGFLSPVHGSGTHVYHLMVNNFFKGRLRYVHDEWVFDTNDGSKGWDSLADFFGEAIEKKMPR